MRRLYLLFTFLVVTLMACAQSDGTYCADVGRYNPKTGKESSYRLTVGVKSNQVVRLDWPNGHSIGGDEFSPSSIRNNRAVFKTYRGVDFVVKILKKGSDCFGDVQEARQCISTTKAGRQCKNMTASPTKRCHVHDK